MSRSVLDDTINILEEEIEDQTITYINNLDKKEFQKLLLQNSPSKFPFINTIVSFRLDLFEGMEDFHIKSYKKLSEDTFYIDCEFELRTCTLILGIPMSEYVQNKEQIDNYYYNVYFAEGDVYFERYIRPHFVANFILDVNMELVEGLELALVTFDVRNR